MAVPKERGPGPDRAARDRHRRRQLWKTIVPADPGVYSIINFHITPTGSAYCYSYRRRLSDLYLIEGLR